MDFGQNDQTDVLRGVGLTRFPFVGNKRCRFLRVLSCKEGQGHHPKIGRFIPLGSGLNRDPIESPKRGFGLYAMVVLSLSLIERGMSEMLKAPGLPSQPATVGFKSLITSMLEPSLCLPC